MDRAAVNAHCAALPGAAWSEPFGPGVDVWKVGDKMFALMGTAEGGVTLKCADAATAALLIEIGRAERAPYLTRGGWILIRFDTMDDAEVVERLATSYRTVRAGLTKKRQAALPPLPEEG